MASHPVQAGEHMVRIAADLRIANYSTLWDHPSNADLKQRRNPNILLPGDRVNVPNPAPKTVTVPTTRKHKFVAESQDVLDLRVALLDENSQPMSGMKCQFPEEGSEVTADGGGVLERKELSASFELGMLRFVYRVEDLSQRGNAPANVFQGNEKVELAFAIAVGHLDPYDTPSGIQERLSNLGYYAGEIGYATEDALALRCAIEEFEKENGLTPKGDATNASFQTKLKDVHGC